MLTSFSLFASDNDMYVDQRVILELSQDLGKIIADQIVVNTAQESQDINKAEIETSI